MPGALILTVNSQKTSGITKHPLGSKTVPQLRNTGPDYGWRELSQEGSSFALKTLGQTQPLEVPNTKRRDEQRLQNPLTFLHTSENQWEMYFKKVSIKKKEHLALNL